MSAREEVLKARKALLNGGGKLSYFERRGLSEETVKGAWIGYSGGEFLYPCIGRTGGLLAVHYKGEARNGKGKRSQRWGLYADDLPRKGHGKKPDDPAKIIPFGLETLEGLEPGSPVVLCCGEEDALSLRQAGYTALSQPGAGLLEPVYARELAGYEAVVFYDAGEEQEARKDALKLMEAGAESVRVVEWPPDAPNGADINGQLIEDPEGFEEWAAEMIAAARSVSETGAGSFATDRAGEPDRYGGAGTRNGKAPGPVGLLLSEVVPERIEWFWRGRIPKGKLTLIDGNPGEGKSALSADLAARKSVGRPWPDGEPCEAGGVVICSAEDGLSDTIRPRLDAAGGDPSRVLALATVKDRNGERLISIPEDLGAIRQGIERVGAELVIVDPLMAFLSGEHNAHKDQDVRRALAPLAKLAEETRAAVVVIRHLNKASGGNPLYRGGGSIGIIGAARSALLVARHPDDERRRVLAPLKSNLAEPAPSLAFTLTEAANGAVRVEWKGETALSAAALLAGPVDDEERDALTEAQEFLGEVLTGGPVPAREVQDEAQAAGIAKRTLDRARKALGVEASRKGEAGKRGGGTWVWGLPGIKVANPETWQPKSDNGHDDPENPAYLSQKPDTGLRLPNDEEIKDATDVGNLNRGSESGGSSDRRLTVEEVQKVRKLISEGMAPHLARAEVLGETGEV